MIETVNKIGVYDKTVECMPDKSMSVRAVIFNGYARGTAKIKNLLKSDDVMSAVGCMRALGAEIETDGTTAVIKGAQFNSAALDCGNSGTTARLLVGLLSGVNGEFRLTGDESLSTRPMRRVTDPLKAMGANISHTDGRLPVTVNGAKLHGIDYDMPVASAQVKSALLLAGLNAEGAVTVRENIKSRDHTENMLKAMGADISVVENAVTIKRSKLESMDFTVPGDISSAAYPLCLALATGGRCTVKNVGINRTRTGILDVLEAMGANIEYGNLQNGAEPSADITVRKSVLRPFIIDAPLVPRLVDEIPVLCALACFVDGESVVKGARELRVKETDRIETTVNALRSLGADIRPTDDGMIIRGGKKLAFGTVETKKDHRIAMTAAVAGAAAEGVRILDSECVDVSYPGFFKEVIGD